MEDCYICFKPNTDNITTLCNHNVHKPCFMEWKIKNNTCPICRKINPIHEYTLLDNKVLSNKVLSSNSITKSNYLYNLIQFYIYLFLVFIISYNFFRLLNQII